MASAIRKTSKPSDPLMVLESITEIFFFSSDSTRFAALELLDQVPLHIRLVGSHVRAERPAAILAGLHDTKRRHHLTTAELSDEAAHHQSQELSFRYTYDLLSEGGRRLWAVLAAVFAGEPGRAGGVVPRRRRVAPAARGWPPTSP